MVKKYSDFINEGFMTRSLDRNKNNELRKEDGIKVTNQYGVDIVIKDSNCDYKNITKLICNSGHWGDFRYEVSNLHSSKNRLQYDAIKQDKCDYKFLISDVDVIEYPEYDDIAESTPTKLNLNEDDYKSILRGIVEALRKTKFIISNGQIYFTLVNERDSLKIQKRLRDDDELEYGEYILDDFKDKFIDKCPKSIRIDFKEWGKPTPCIGVRFISFTLKNYEKLLNFTKKFFKIN